MALITRMVVGEELVIDLTGKMEAAKEIKTLITASVDRVSQGTALVDQAGATMAEVVASIRRVTDIIGKPQMLAGDSVSADGLTWTMTLRDGLVFHDGERVLAKDCVASLARWAKRDAFGQLLDKVVELWGTADDRTILPSGWSWRLYSEPPESL